MTKKKLFDIGYYIAIALSALTLICVVSLFYFQQYFFIIHLLYAKTLLFQILRITRNKDEKFNKWCEDEKGNELWNKLKD
jgi:hypothetical protein